MACCGKLPETSPTKPVTIGSTNGDEARQVKLNMTFGGHDFGSIIWVTGDGVDSFVNISGFGVFV
jgi:hypothetical protein